VNPLLEIQFRIPFDEIQAIHVEPAIDILIQEAREAQRAIGLSEDPRTFDNTLLAMEHMTEKLDWALGVVRHLESVATYPELRAAYNAVQPRASLFYTEIALDPVLWRALKEFASTEEAQNLRPVPRRFLKKRMDDFRRHGADLDEPGKARLKAIDVELAQLTTKFAENVLDATNEFELLIQDEAKLAGLPPSALEAARESARSKNLEGWRFTLQAPSYNAVMTYLADRSIREQSYRAFNSRASGSERNNGAIVARVLELRQEKAALLEYRNFAELVLEERMARSGETAKRFLEDLALKTRARFDQENADLAEFRKSIEPGAADPLQPWDIAYYAEKQRAALYDFDEEALRPYFPLEQVLRGMFQLVERLFAIRVREVSGVPVWDPAVKYYLIEDEDGSELGAFYADWFPRENKRGGAWMDAFLTGHPTADGKWTPHLGLMCGNLNPPVGGKPALLTHRDVETVFHEFGHLLHHCLSRVEIRSLAGTNVAWDFVELPSQIMENWCWERPSLDLFASHYETGEPIPDDLFAKMKRARTFRAANAQMRQLSFGTLDLALHTAYSPERDGNVVSFARQLMQTFAVAPLPEEYAMICGFTHLFASPVGYAAGYYSYKWAEVLDADAFSRFQEVGVFDRGAGLDFRHTILAKGDSEDPAELYRAFMGRDPDPSALLRRAGLA
jgi:oligopeptidase A